MYTEDDIKLYLKNKLGFIPDMVYCVHRTTYETYQLYGLRARFDKLVDKSILLDFIGYRGYLFTHSLEDFSENRNKRIFLKEIDAIKQCEDNLKYEPKVGYHKCEQCSIYVPNEQILLRSIETEYEKYSNHCFCSEGCYEQYDKDNSW